MLDHFDRLATSRSDIRAGLLFDRSIDATAAGAAAPKVEANAPAAPLVESGAAQQVVIPPAGTDKATDAAAKVDSSSVSKKPSKGTAKAAKAK